MNLALSSKDSRCTLTTWLLARTIVTNPSHAIPARIAVEKPYASMITAVMPRSRGLLDSGVFVRRASTLPSHVDFLGS